MDRREQIERIIIGTLLSSDSQLNFYNYVKCSITSDMFRDNRNRRLFEMITEMNQQGIVDTNPYNIYMKYGEAVTDLLYYMCENAMEWCYFHRKVEYNERQWLIYQSYGIRPKYTNVTFEDYINRFITLVFENEQQQRQKAY